MRRWLEGTRPTPKVAIERLRTWAYALDQTAQAIIMRMGVPAVLLLYRRDRDVPPWTKRTRPVPRQYTVADLERARDRVAAAERRIDNDRRSNPNRGRAGLERAQLELSVIESQLRLRGLLD